MDDGESIKKEQTILLSGIVCFLVVSALYKRFKLSK